MIVYAPAANVDGIGNILKSGKRAVETFHKGYGVCHF